MRIFIYALGSRGDVFPYVTLGRGLLQAGHQVTVATFESFGAMVRESGVEFHCIPGDAEEMLRMAAEAGMLEKGTNPLRVVRALKTSYGRLTNTSPGSLSSLRGTDLILNQLPGDLYGPDMAEYLGIPHAIVSVIPLARSRTRPLLGFPTALAFLPGYNRLTYRIGEQMAWQMFRASINRWRVKELGLKPQPFFGPYERIERERVPIINGFSEHVFSRPGDWGEHIHLTGWWVPEEPTWQPPHELLRFLDDGLAPVFFGLGSMMVGDPQRVANIVVEAAQRAGVRAILHAGWAGLDAVLPPEIMRISYAPYGWLFQRMAAVAHHGGSGTTGFALRSGVPSFVIPFVFDQFYWGRRSAELGVGPKPLPVRDLHPELLAERFRDAVENPGYQRASAALSRKLNAENGIQRAIQVIENL